MQRKKTELQIVDQDIALDSYLSTLLNDIPDDLELDQELVQAEQTVVQKPVQIKTAVEAKQKSVIQKVELPKEQKQPQPEKLIKPLSVMPEWTQHEFQALFFKVDHLILAAPLTDLLRTIRIDKQPTKIPGQPSWFIGLLDNHQNRIGVLDTGQLIFGKTKGQERNLDEKPFQSILITHDGKWGIACDEILSIGKLLPDKVRWRTLRQKRPWLVGTVIEELTAIIDVNQLVPHRKAS